MPLQEMPAFSRYRSDHAVPLIANMLMIIDCSPYDTFRIARILPSLAAHCPNPDASSSYNDLRCTLLSHVLSGECLGSESGACATFSHYPCRSTLAADTWTCILNFNDLSNHCLDTLTQSIVVTKVARNHSRDLPLREAIMSHISRLLSPPKLPAIVSGSFTQSSLPEAAVFAYIHGLSVTARRPALLQSVFEHVTSSQCQQPQSPPTLRITV
jgi:hypothetical protein